MELSGLRGETHVHGCESLPGSNTRLSDNVSVRPGVVVSLSLRTLVSISARPPYAPSIPSSLRGPTTVHYKPNLISSPPQCASHPQFVSYFSLSLNRNYLIIWDRLEKVSE